MLVKRSPAGSSEAERFFDKVDKAGPVAENNPELGHCWLWTASATPNGYGRFVMSADPDGFHRHVPAHVWAYEHLVGPIPDGLVLDHFACDRRICCNPAHVRPTTHRENILRGTGGSARNARKTHCIRGHELTPENLYYNGRNGGRACRKCKAIRRARRAS
jgi:hypothetical protein